jgi:hypothetical protein
VYDGENTELDEFLNAFQYDVTTVGLDADGQAKAIQFCLAVKALSAFKRMAADD